MLMMEEMEKSDNDNSEESKIYTKSRKSNNTNKRASEKGQK